MNLSKVATKAANKAKAARLTAAQKEELLKKMKTLLQAASKSNPVKLSEMLNKFDTKMEVPQIRYFVGQIDGIKFESKRGKGGGTFAYIEKKSPKKAAKKTTKKTPKK